MGIEKAQRPLKFARDLTAPCPVPCRCRGHDRPCVDRDARVPRRRPLRLPITRSLKQVSKACLAFAFRRRVRVGRGYAGSFASTLSQLVISARIGSRSSRQTVSALSPSPVRVQPALQRRQWLAPKPSGVRHSKCAALLRVMHSLPFLSRELIRGGRRRAAQILGNPANPDLGGIGKVHARRRSPGAVEAHRESIAVMMLALPLNASAAF